MQDYERAVCQPKLKGKAFEAHVQKVGALRAAHFKAVRGAAPPTERVSDLYNLANAIHPTSDKFTDHQYQLMYGTFLLPLKDTVKLKIFEIGLGCDMTYGSGASVQIWASLFPLAKVWEAEYDASCVTKAKDAGKLADVNVVVGDQADPATLASWIEQTGGQFDVIIDDGGHTNVQIQTSFGHLWPALKPGGFYFIEVKMFLLFGAIAIY
jgi:hypothetical protein